MYRFGFYINIATIELKTFVILQPVEGGVSLFDLQWRTEDRFVRHFCFLHFCRQPAVFHASFQFTAEVLGTRQQLPLFPCEIFPCRLKTRLFRGLERNIQRQPVYLPARLRRQPDFAQLRGEFCGH